MSSNNGFWRHLSVPAIFRDPLDAGRGSSLVQTVGPFFAGHESTTDAQLRGWSMRVVNIVGANRGSDPECASGPLVRSMGNHWRKATGMVFGSHRSIDFRIAEGATHVDGDFNSRHGHRVRQRGSV